MVRAAFLSGACIPNVSTQTLLQTTIFSLPLDLQNRAIDLNREIRELTLGLKEQSRALWHRPLDAPKIREAVNRLNQKDAFEAWIESLPFPLASILSRYQATSNIEHKTVHLLKGVHVRIGDNANAD